MRIQGIGLEHHRDIANGRLQLLDMNSVEFDFSGVLMVESGKQALSARSWDFGQVDERCGNTVAMIDS